ncbi:hypothetical protein D9M70_558140 [compost metagenome]
MLGEHHDGALVEQAFAAGLFQIGGELQAQALDALVILGEQLRLDAEQIAVLGRGTEVQRDLAAQVGQVVVDRAAFGPACVGGEQDDENKEDQLAHAGLRA